MQLTIDNLDGRGAVDYTSAVVAGEDASTLKIERALGQPSRCTMDLLPGPGTLAQPVRFARVAVTSAAATVLFTGYVAIEPVRSYAGETTTGPVYTTRLTAIEDEPLLDRSSASAGGAPTLLGESSQSVTERVAAGLRGGPAPVLTTGVTHTFRDGDGILTLAEGSVAHARELAGDITLSGATEPGALVTECFLGDGVSNVFPCSKAFFHPGNATLLQDTFDSETLDSLRWATTDPGGHLSLTESGFTFNGGSGVDGQTSLTALDLLEMGGSLVLELHGVQLGAASDGVLAGLYTGTLTLPDCFAGFRIRQTATGTSSATTLVPLLNGVEVGSAYTPLAGHSYTLRLRLHCVEQQRVMQRYTCMADGVIESFGSAGGVDAPMDLVFELVDEGLSSNTPATVLYDTAATGTNVSGTPATCIFAVMTAKQMFGSVASMRIAHYANAWVTSTLPSGVTYTRLQGTAGEGVDCVVTRGGTVEPAQLTFLPGRTPLVNERVTVQYRLGRRAVARLQNVQGSGRWLGRVVSPVARSSVDCESAAQALLAVSASRSAGVAGTCRLTNPLQDIAPGDVLALASADAASACLVSSVTLVDGAALPEVLRYTVALATDHATQVAAGLGVVLSEAIASDATLPATASTSPTQALANLQQLTVTSISTGEVHLDAGTAAPSGGGFEVRRRDAGFGTAGVDLVLRTPVRGISLPRAMQNERFYVRMYDGSTPPVFSRFASAVFVHAPVS